MEPERYMAICRCYGEGVVVLSFEPTKYSEHDDIILSTWREWNPNSLKWRIWQAWKVLTEREKLAEYGVCLSRDEARKLGDKLVEFAAKEYHEPEVGIGCLLTELPAK